MSTVAVARLLAELETLGVTISLNGSNLRLHRSDLIPPDLRAALRRHKPGLVALLTCHCGQPLNGNRLECPACVEHVYAACDAQQTPGKPVLVQGGNP